jgi:hypothetical protein
MNASPAWPQPDFLAAGPRRPARAGWLAAAGLLALALCLAAGLVQKRRVDAEAARLAGAEQRVARLAPTPQTGRASPSRRSDAREAKADVEAARAARQVIEHLTHPWGQLLANVEAETPPGVQWLLLDHDSDGTELRFEGLAPDAETVLHLVDMLAGRSGWSDVALTRLLAPNARDAREDNGTAPLWRFEIRAAVDAQQLVLAARHASSD